MFDDSSKDIQYEAMCCTVKNRERLVQYVMLFRACCVALPFVCATDVQVLLEQFTIW